MHEWPLSYTQFKVCLFLTIPFTILHNWQNLYYSMYFPTKVTQCAKNRKCCWLIFTRKELKSLSGTTHSNPTNVQTDECELQRKRRQRETDSCVWVSRQVAAGDAYCHVDTHPMRKQPTRGERAHVYNLQRVSIVAVRMITIYSGVRVTNDLCNTPYPDDRVVT